MMMSRAVVGMPQPIKIHTKAVMISANSSLSACQGKPKLRQGVVATQSITAR